MLGIHPVEHAFLRSLKLATAQSPMTMTMRNYWQIAITMSKDTYPVSLKPFDHHLPNDFDGFLSRLSFQTRHKPATRPGAYALENSFPSRLQPDLIHRYLGKQRHLAEVPFDQ